MHKLPLLALGLALATPALLCAQPEPPQGNRAAEAPPPPHTGIWWGSKSKEYRDGYIVGYKNGEAHGAGHKTAIAPLPASELVTGLDVFYKDFRNRNILVDDALTYVQDQLTGVPDDKLNVRLLKMRAAAAPGNVD